MGIIEIVMHKILLTKGLYAVVDGSDADLINSLGWNWQASKSHYTDTHYAASYRPRANGEFRAIYMHRLILGVTDPDIDVDHRDGNGLNNCRSNLRLCNASQNAANMAKPRGALSQYKGVHRCAGKWRAQITHLGKRHHLGYFVGESDAARAYDAAARALFGEFARTNFQDAC